MASSSGSLEAITITAAPMPTATGAASEPSGRCGMASAAARPISAPKLIERNEAFTPCILPPAMKCTPQAMNDIQTCRLRVASGGKVNTQVSMMASTKMVTTSAVNLGIGFLPRGLSCSSGPVTAGRHGGSLCQRQ